MEHLEGANLEKLANIFTVMEKKGNQRQKRLI